MSPPSSARKDGPVRPPGLVVAGVVVLVEAAAIGVYAVVTLLAAPASPYATTAFGVGGTALVSALLLLAVGIGLLRGRAWSRTAAIVWQLVQVLVGAYAFQGQGAQPGFGFLAILPAVLVIVLLFSRPVRAATQRG